MSGDMIGVIPADDHMIVRRRVKAVLGTANDTYNHRIQEKLGLAHRSDYIQLALRLGLLVA